MLRMESANQEIDGRQLPPLGENARPKYKLGFGECTDEHVFEPFGSMLMLLAFLRLAQGLG